MPESELTVSNKTSVVADDDGLLKSAQGDNRTKSLFDGAFNFVDSNIRWIRYGVYGVGAVGVFLIVRGTYSMKVFGRVSELPSHYISGNVTLQGRVINVGGDSCLHVQHRPIITPPSIFTSRRADHKEALPVHIAGIEANPVGRKWLVDNVKGQHVWFKLLERSPDDTRIDCLVLMKKNIFSRRVLNEELIKLGVCRMKDYPLPPTSPAYNRLLERLVAMEARVDRKNASGLRRFSKTVKSLFQGLVSLPGRFRSLMTRFKRK